MTRTERRVPEVRRGARQAGVAPWAVLVAVSISGCAGDNETRLPTSGDPEADQRADQRVSAEDGKGTEKRTLYVRLGGEAGIAAIVDDMTPRVIADPRVNFERKDVKRNWFGGKVKPWVPNDSSIDAFKRHMIEFLSLAAGGPSQYTGGDIRSVHKGMAITNVEFDSLVGDVKATMDKLGVGTREKRDLLAIIETTRKQIVEK